MNKNLDEIEDKLEASDTHFVASLKKARAEHARGEVFLMEDVFGAVE